ncbi:hypothetical protein, partial [Corallococcus exiguus]|uniref:hypothetical protein n=1 Tax=Corallococcus exiguus TaxID=83462 RepID=UPI001C26135D
MLEAVAEAADLLADALLGGLGLFLRGLLGLIASTPRLFAGFLTCLAGLLRRRVLVQGLSLIYIS